VRIVGYPKLLCHAGFGISVLDFPLLVCVPLPLPPPLPLPLPLPHTPVVTVYRRLGHADGIRARNQEDQKEDGDLPRAVRDLFQL